MKKVLFLCTHLGSASKALYDALETNSRIQGYKSQNINIYHSNYNLINLMETRHKLRKSSSAIFMDEINYNFQLDYKNLSKSCKFIYFVRNPLHSVVEMVRMNKYKISNACRYYSFRLRRLCEMSRITKGAVFLTFDDLCQGKGIELIQEYLELTSPIKFNPDAMSFYNRGLNTDLLGPTVRSQISDSYERYLYFLKNQSLRRPQ